MEDFNIQLPWPGWRAVKYLGSGQFGSVYEVERAQLGRFVRQGFVRMVAAWAPEEKGTLEEIASLTGTRIIGAEPISYVTLDELGHAERVRVWEDGMELTVDR